jgi:hypothetical protein
MALQERRMISEFSQLRVGSGNEGVLQASKWLELQLLVDEVEMQELFKALNGFEIYTAGAVCKRSEGLVSHSDFLNLYKEYIDSLKKGILPDEEVYRLYFSSVFTVDSSHLFQIELPKDRRIIRVGKPVLQLQMNKIAYTPLDGKFRSLVLGRNAILWGLQFSFPQLYRDPVTCEVFKTNDHTQFPNGRLFRHLQLWSRQATVPTPFVVNSQRVNVPFRLGKNCLSWINHHPQLAEHGISVASKGAGG